LKRSVTYLILSLLYVMQGPAQSRQFNLVKGNCQRFRGYLYCYGFLSRGANASFCIYKLNGQLTLLDSLVTEQGKGGLNSYLQASSDTLHDFLNIYLQQKEKKLVTVLRFNKSFEQVATVNNIDVARLNSISAFENELLYSGKYVYTVKSQEDSSGRQFYLNKFSLKPELKNFEYEFTWQFPFERQYIHSAHVFYADRQVVYLYVQVSGGPKEGQWILTIQAGSGKLVRGTKLNKGETGTCEFGHFSVDTLKRSLTMAGQKFSASQLNMAEKKLSISNAPFVSFYLAEIDSTGEIQKQEFKVPVTEAKTNSRKIISNYLLRFSRLNKNAEGKISLEADLFKNSDNALSYRYVNTGLFLLLPSDDQLLLEKNTIASNPQIEKFYFSADKTDRNGRLQTDSLSGFGALFYAPLNFPVKQGFKTDADNNPIWLLKKSLPQKNTIQYSLLSPVKKIYQLGPVEEINAFHNPACFILSNSAFVIGQQVGEIYQLKVYNW
jgi:hypothetical protein